MATERAQPEGYHSVTPRIVVSNAAASFGFLQRVFDATGDVVADRPIEARIGDSLVLITSAGVRDRFPGFLYIYVDDADLTYQRALAEGAVSLEAPMDTPYGDRRAMVRDTYDNVFQIAQRS